MTRHVPFASLALAVLGTACAARSTPSGPIPVTKLAANVYLLAAPSGNMVAATGKDGIFLVGTQSSSETPQVRQALAGISAAPLRYVVFAAGDSTTEEGDAGWNATGATVVTHERLRRAMQGASPALGFSEVLQFYLDGESMHAVHQPPGHTRADFIVHFENAGVLYLGDAFIAHGYPRIDVSDSASIDSLIAEVGPFANFGDAKIVPGRGPLSTTKDVAAYRDMLTAVRDTVRALARAGRSLADVVAAKPTARWDSAYARGGVQPAEFVEEVYRSVRR